MVNKMENSLINPLWVYLIDVLSGLNIISIVCLIFGLVGCVVLGAFYFMMVFDDCFDEEDSEFKMMKFGFKTSIIVAIISAIIMVAIPSEKTLYTMFVTSYLTEENITNATESVTDVIDYIFEKVDQLQND